LPVPAIVPYFYNPLIFEKADSSLGQALAIHRCVNQAVLGGSKASAFFDAHSLRTSFLNCVTMVLKVFQDYNS
jgi:hypothetical protein